MQNFSEKCEVSNSEKLGRHLVAGMDISPGEMILEERPLMVAPHWDCDQMKCTRCFRSSFVICKKCQMFPLCIDCSIHDDFECEFFQTAAAKKISKNLLVKNYAIFAALKLLLLMENGKTSAEAEGVINRKLNLDDYRGSEMWEEQTKTVVEPLLKSGIGELCTKVKVDGDFLHKLCILIDANSFEVTSKEGDSLKGVYVYGAKFPHHCVPNTVLGIDDDFNMQIYASVPIRRGEIIYNSYSNPMMGTSQRQHLLRMTRHIDCTCSRCLDPAELGTHMSSMKCKQCSEGFAVCDPTKGAHWKCLQCSAVMDAIAVHELLAEVGEEMVSANGDLNVYENLLAKYSGLFHPNHFLIVDIKQNIATILRALSTNPMRSAGRTAKSILVRRVQLCEEILPVVRAVLPGISKLYAIALYEYLMPFLELSEVELKDKDIPLESYLSKQNKAKDMAKDILEMLAFELPNSPEGQLVECIRMELSHIDECIKKHSGK